MVFTEFKKSLNELKFSLDNAVSNNIDLSKASTASLSDFPKLKENSFRQAVFSAIAVLENKANKLKDSNLFEKADQENIGQIIYLAKKLKLTKDAKEISLLMERIAEIASELKASEQKQAEFPVPAEIKDELNADLRELDRCFRSGCYRSAIILCGRILETALHRKYFEATGNDLLEKAPGIGLGNLIAKISEKGISLDPGLSNQIHLINQVRIYSVHTKRDVFYPSQEQTQAIMLYTRDVVNKLFKK